MISDTNFDKLSMYFAEYESGIFDKHALLCMKQIILEVLIVMFIIF